MSVIIKTELTASINEKMFDAFLHGQIYGKYTLYVELNKSKISIEFENEEDATAFRLAELDVVYQTTYAEKLNNMLGDPFGNPFINNYSHNHNSNNIFGNIATRKS